MATRRVNAPALSKGQRLGLLDDLDERLRRRGAISRMHVIGGACIALAYRGERRTEDIDARIEAGHGALSDAVRAIAREKGLAESWLNEQATSAIPNTPDQRARTLYQSQHLTVTGASPEHLMAMKLEAARDKDVGDIETLIAHMGMHRCEDALAIHREVFPESERSAQARALLEAMARRTPDLAPPELPDEERAWLEALGANAWPRLRRSRDAKGLTLEVQDTAQAAPRILKEGLTLQGLARLECAYRGWPEKATTTIKGFAAASLERKATKQE